MSSQAMVTVLFFASLREAVGHDRLQCAIADAADIKALLQHLHALLPPAGAAAITASNVKIAVNQTLVSDNLHLQPGDEVAFLPPVTGG